MDQFGADSYSETQARRKQHEEENKNKTKISNMSVNSSSLFSSSHLFNNCLVSKDGNAIFAAFTSTSILFLLPLYGFVLYLGHQRKRQHGSASSSPSDYITYHMVFMALVDVLASIFYCVGIYAGLVKMVTVATNVFFTAMCGHMFFLNIICIECYIAVVHPIRYLHMRNGPWARARNVVIWCIWLLGCARMSMTVLSSVDVLLLVYFAQLVFSLVVVSFCSLPLLRAFTRPGPGEGSGDRERVDQSKQRVFHTILALVATLLFRFGGILVCTAVYASPHMSENDRCVAIFVGHWFSLPNTLTAPLLFLHRAGKLPVCRESRKTGHEST